MGRRGTGPGHLNFKVPEPRRVVEKPSNWALFHHFPGGHHKKTWNFKWAFWWRRFLRETFQTPLFHWRGRCGTKCPISPNPVGLGLCVTQRGQVSLPAGLILSPSCYHFGSGPGTWGLAHGQHRAEAGQGCRATCPSHRHPASTCHLHCIPCAPKGKRIPHSPYYS